MKEREAFNLLTRYFNNPCQGLLNKVKSNWSEIESVAEKVKNQKDYVDHTSRILLNHFLRKYNKAKVLIKSRQSSQHRQYILNRC